ncbi:hypothetical protein FKN08_12555 [Vibrio sp. 1-2 (7-a)]|nr:hypothetical protein [Vibrio sp. 1-2 (7-a)]
MHIVALLTINFANCICKMQQHANMPLYALLIMTLSAKSLLTCKVIYSYTQMMVRFRVLNLTTAPKP